MFQGGVMPTEVAIVKIKQTNGSTTKQGRNSCELFTCLRHHSRIDGSFQVGLAIAAPAWETPHQLCLHSRDWPRQKTPELWPVLP